MVGIRSITYQLPEDHTEMYIPRIAKLSRIWDSKFSSIRTQRVCFCPFTKRVNMERFQSISELCSMSSVRWFNVPIDPWHSDNLADLFNFAYDVLAENSRAFVNVLGVADQKLRPDILQRCGELVRKTSVLSMNGKDNFRLGVSVNVAPNGPFFPFTYSSGTYGFSIALELTQDINEICTRLENVDLMSLREAILDSIIPQVEKINQLAEEIERQSGCEFHGFDFSLAPIIGENGSVMTILNRLGIYNFGETGTLFATGYLTNILKYLATQFKSVGFSGVMYSPLEDLDLCMINNQRSISLESLISLSTMCGCGVDMVPVCGQIKTDEFLSVFLEVAGVSCRLNKPLGVRLLPIPACRRGSAQFTSFYDDSDFIANTRIVGLDLNLLSDIGTQMTYLPVK